MVDIRESEDHGGRRPFQEWFERLNSEASLKITAALYRMGLGNFSNSKSIGAGAHECTINFGPGYRVYFGKDGEQIVVLLGGGTKQRQHNDIRLALERWEDYKQRKKEQRKGGMKMALTRDFRETVQARVKCDPAFRQGLLSEAIESLLSGEVALGKELLRDYVNATVGFSKLAAHTKIHVKTLHQMLGPNGNPTASHLFGIVAYLQHREGVRLEIRSARAVSRSRRRAFALRASRTASTAVSH